MVGVAVAVAVVVVVVVGVAVAVVVGVAVVVAVGVVVVVVVVVGVAAVVGVVVGVAVVVVVGVAVVVGGVMSAAVLTVGSRSRSQFSPNGREKLMTEQTNLPASEPKRTKNPSYVVLRREGSERSASLALLTLKPIAASNRKEAITKADPDPKPGEYTYCVVPAEQWKEIVRTIKPREGFEESFA
jgi:hypothetical protein